MLNASKKRSINSVEKLMECLQAREKESKQTNTRKTSECLNKKARKEDITRFLAAKYQKYN